MHVSYCTVRTRRHTPLDSFLKLSLEITRGPVAPPVCFCITNISMNTMKCKAWSYRLNRVQNRGSESFVWFVVGKLGFNEVGERHQQVLVEIEQLPFDPVTEHITNSQLNREFVCCLSLRHIKSKPETVSLKYKALADCTVAWAWTKVLPESRTNGTL